MNRAFVLEHLEFLEHLEHSIINNILNTPYFST